MADWCTPLEFVNPAAYAACEAARKVGGTVGGVVSFASDPLGFIAKACADAVTWLWSGLATLIGSTTRVDFTNSGFLQEYALVFAASSVVVVILWLWAVAKRAVRGMPVGQALGESVGFLVLAVGASALAPAVLVLLMGLVDAATAGLASGLAGNTDTFLTGASKALVAMLAPSTPGGAVTAGPVVVIFLSVLGLLIGLVVWAELLLASAALYVAAVFGPLVFAGLVDRAHWGAAKKWLSVVVGLALVKPVLVTVLGLAAGLAAAGGPADGFSSVMEAIGLLLLSVFASYAVYRVVPVVGEHLGELHGARKAAQSSGPAAAVPGPATVMSASVSAHMMPSGGGGGGGGAADRPAIAAATPAPRTNPPAPPPPPTPPPAPAPAPVSAGRAA